MPMRSAVTYAAIVTIDAESSESRLPVSSNTSTMPVMGALTTLAKRPAIPRTMKLVRNAWLIPKQIVKTLPKMQPESAPMTTRGNRVPPGAPEPKHMEVKAYFAMRRMTRNARLFALEFLTTSMIPLPPHSSWGNVNAINPSQAKGVEMLS